MNKRLINISLITFGLLFLIVTSSAFIVEEGQSALVTRLGKITRANLTPGINFKIPVVEKVDKFDARLRTLNTDPETVLTAEKKYLVIDYFVEWKIKDNRQFFIRTRGSIRNAEQLIDQIVSRIIRNEIAKRDVVEVVAKDRIVIRESITSKLKKEMDSEGIDVIDVRIKRVEFANSILPSVYERMRSERLRISNKFRAEGREDAAKIIAEADKNVQVILATAEKEAEIIRGKAEAKAIDIYAKSFNKDFSFYLFQKTLENYENAFNDKSDTFITKPKSDFFKYFESAESKNTK